MIINFRDFHDISIEFSYPACSLHRVLSFFSPVSRIFSIIRQRGLNFYGCYSRAYSWTRRNVVFGAYRRWRRPENYQITVFYFLPDKSIICRVLPQWWCDRNNTKLFSSTNQKWLFEYCWYNTEQFSIKITIPMTIFYCIYVYTIDWSIIGICDTRIIRRNFKLNRIIRSVIKLCVCDV